MKKTFKARTARLLSALLAMALLMSSATIAASAGSVATALGGTTTESYTVTDGLTYESVTFTKGNAGQTAYVMEFNPETSGLLPMAYHKTASWGVTVANNAADAIANGYTVYGAVNGEFFSMASGNAGTLTGRLISNGRIISDHETCDEMCIVIDNNGQMQLVQSELAYHFYVDGKEKTTADGNALIARINKRYNGNWGYDPFCYFDSSCGSKTDTISDYPGVEVVFNKTNGTELTPEGVLQGEVVSVTENTYASSFTEDQFVLYAYKDSAYYSYLSTLTAGQEVQIYAEELNESAKDIMKNANSVSSATYPIVVNGVDNTDNTPNASDIYMSYAQRTAIGVKADGTYVFFCSAGRGTSDANTKGVTLPQLADIMIDLGCVTAVNLDGGGSPTMWVNGTLEYENTNRAVASSILIVGREGAAVDSDAKAALNDWIYNAEHTEYATAEQTALVAAAVAEAKAVYNDANSLTGDYVREMMDIQQAMGAVQSVAPKTYISLDASDWSYDASIMQASNDANGALVLNNTNGLWPSASLSVDMEVPADYRLYFDITIAGQSVININSAGMGISLNSLIAPNSLDSGSGDIVGNGQTFKGSVSVADISANGLDLSTLTILAVGGAGDGSKVTIREFEFRSPYADGDINGDGAINSTDARLALVYIAGGITLSDAQVSAADVDASGAVDTADVRTILMKRVGLA